MEEFIRRFEARGAHIRAAYTSEESKAIRPVTNPLVNVLIDVCHRAALAGVDPRDLLHQAQEVYEFEAQFVGEALKEHAAEKAASRMRVAS